MDGATPDFAKLLGIASGFQRSRALSVAAELGIADLLGEGPLPVAELARATRTNEAALYRLLRALAAIEVFREEPGRGFSLGPLGHALRGDAARLIVRYYGRDYYWKSWEHLLHSVRSGETGARAALGVGVHEYRERNPEEHEIFHAAMTALSSAAAAAELAACDLAPCRVVADIGGGRGATLAAILRRHPQASGILFDLPRVVAGASAVLEREGVADRVRVEAGSFFDGVPAGADAYVLRRVLHVWPDAEALAILRCVRAAMRTEARLLLIENVVGAPNADPLPKFRDLDMLVATGGRERTEPEWRALLADGGFRFSGVRSAGPASSVIEAAPG